MKIAVLSRVAHPLHGFGGLERHAGSLVRYLAKEGAEVTLYTSPPERDGEKLDRIHVEPVSYRVFPWPRRAGFVVADRNTNYLVWNIRAAKRLGGKRVDIVHAEAGAGFGYALQRSSQQAPLVLQAQGMEEFKAHWIKRNAYLPLRVATRFAARRAAKVIVPDRVMEEEVRHFLSVPPQRIAILPLAIDLDWIDAPVSDSTRNGILERLKVSPRQTVILSVGRLESNKGFSVLAKALARVRDELPQPWLWVLVGKGPLELHLRKVVRGVSLSERACFAGWVTDPELAVLYRRANVFAHPTLYEGSSLVTLEAMAHRKAVVATRVGGIPDKVEQGKSGFLVPPNDEEALAQALNHALSLGSGLERLGAEGRRRVEIEFNWARRARGLLDLYREIIDSEFSRPS